MEADGAPQASEAAAEKPAEESKPSRPAPSEAELRKTLVFDDALAQLGKKAKPTGLVRYQSNPRSHWGPLARAAAR
jgi:tRNA (guanine26-N2/guanine27-N2)-dimethyltransferase